MKIAIVGAGWAGIAAAVDLTEANHSVTLFEAGRTLGGRARAVELDGRTLDNGQHILLGAYRETLSLIKRVGVNPRQVLRRRSLRLADTSGFRLRLPYWPTPFNLAWGLAAARRVGLGEKLRTARWMTDLKRGDFALPVDKSVTAWLDEAGQTGQLRRHLWEPLCLAALNTPPERASAQIFANVLKDSLGSARRANTDLLLPRQDLGKVLPEPAAFWLENHGADIRRVTRVRSVEGCAQDVRVNGERFDKAIIATAPYHAVLLLAELKTGFAYEPIATVYLQYSPATRLPFALSGLHGGIGQWVVDRGDGLLACIQSGRGAWEQEDDKSLGEALHRELGIGEAPLWRQVIREKRATFACAPNLPRPGHATRHPDIWLAGDYTWPPYPATLEGAILSGRRAARACLAPPPAEEA